MMDSSYAFKRKRNTVKLWMILLLLVCVLAVNSLSVMSVYIAVWNFRFFAGECLILIQHLVLISSSLG
jgi:hypothetical protein